MSFFAENRSRPRLPFDAVTGQEPPLKRLRSFLGGDLSGGDVGYGVGTALGLDTDPFFLSGQARAVPDTSFLGSDAWALRSGYDENILASSIMPTSQLGLSSAAASFIERNLAKLENSQMIAQIDLGVVHAPPVSGLGGIQVPGLTVLAQSRSKTKLCKHFIEGKCKFKGICNFAHSIEELKSLPGEGDLEGKALVEKYRAKADTEKQSAGSGLDAMSAGELKTKLCKHFIDGECKFKGGCHFAHSIQELRKLPEEEDDAGKSLLERYKSKLAIAGGELGQESELLASISNGSAELKAKLCKHFILGNCKFKEHCLFAHSIEELEKLPADGDDAGKALLELYQSKLKDEKPFSGHEPAQTEDVAKADDAKSKVSPEKGFLAANLTVDDKSVRLMKTKMCKHFLLGACKFMDSCTFAHSIEELRPPAEADDLATEATVTASLVLPLKKSSTAVASACQQAAPVLPSAEKPDGKQGTRKGKPCRYFLDGTCRFGQACTFLHDNEQVQATGGTYKTRLCIMWEKDKTCTFGSKCHFAHGQEELRPKTGSSISVSSGLLRGGLEMNALSQAKQIDVLMSLPYAYEITDTHQRPFQIADEAWNRSGGWLNGNMTEMSQERLRGLLNNHGQLEQASSLASLSSLGGLNLGLASTNAFGSLPSWLTR